MAMVKKSTLCLHLTVRNRLDNHRILNVWVLTHSIGSFTVSSAKQERNAVQSNYKDTARFCLSEPTLSFWLTLFRQCLPTAIHTYCHCVWPIKHLLQFHRKITDSKTKELKNYRLMIATFTTRAQIYSLSPCLAALRFSAMTRFLEKVKKGKEPPLF